ncbi:hypothetical protein NIES4071_26910 [Calothrix sp. NIES-4071]|nr:hypothetical protein NIES4071_26910 [Calothrix sp. NIES-4071]BAZ57013.1 hypothetical protein NIES4105_26850 [Calothrix sp. NIES-4105]
MNHKDTKDTKKEFLRSEHPKTYDMEYVLAFIFVGALNLMRRNYKLKLK